MGSSGRQGRSTGLQKLFTAGLALLFLMIVAAASFLVFKQVRQVVASSGNLPSFTQPGGSGGSGGATPEPGVSLKEWQGNERVNVLVMGIDERAGVEEKEDKKTLWRTDTMMVLTIDPVTMSAGVLSIPRDLWVLIPGYEKGRINTAHYLGEAFDYPGGGPALAAKTVEYNLGIPIHHYARVNFTAFVELVDRIGGVDVHVEEEIDDPQYPSSDPADPYGYEHLHIPAGKQHFDGEMALKYARTRHGSSDFDRAARQQKLLRAIFEKVTRLNMLPKLASQATQIWRTLQGSVETDPTLTLDKIIALAHLASKVEPQDIRYGVIDESCTIFWETPEGEQVLVPDRARMRELRDYIFTAEGASPGDKDPATRLEEEGAEVQILNGTLKTGLASRVAERLRQEGVKIANIGNADRFDVSESIVIAYTDRTYTAEYIARFLDLPQAAVVQDSDPGAEYDITVILGADYQPPEQ